MNLDLLELSILLVTAGICGSLAELIVGYNPTGMVTIVFSIIVGVIGAFIGTWIFSIALGLPGVFTIRVGTERFSLLWATLGSMLLLLALQGLRLGERFAPTTN
jgi:uncharacterized membrane protein YeaQ/YmgE (transglycosylase-associated protein family)